MTDKQAIDGGVSVFIWIASEQVLILNVADRAFLRPREDFTQVEETFDGALTDLSPQVAQARKMSLLK